MIDEEIFPEKSELFVESMIRLSEGTDWANFTTMIDCAMHAITYRNPTGVGYAADIPEIAKISSIHVAGDKLTQYRQYNIDLADLTLRFNAYLDHESSYGISQVVWDRRIWPIDGLY